MFNIFTVFSSRMLYEVASGGSFHAQQWYRPAKAEWRADSFKKFWLVERLSEEAQVHAPQLLTQSFTSALNPASKGGDGGQWALLVRKTPVRLPRDW